MKRKTDLIKKLNLQYLELLNKTEKTGQYDFPVLYCDLPIIPDYISLYPNLAEYHKTDRTCVAFYTYDQTFDGWNGLYNAIRYDRKDLLDKYKKRFSDVDMFISPDYSLCGDIDSTENIYRMQKSKIVSIWLTLELHSIVIPNITYSCEKDFDFFLDGLENVKYVAFSTKGAVRNIKDTRLLISAIKKTTDQLSNLEGIIVYDVCKDNTYIDNVFSYPREKNIEIIIPDNILKNRNKEIWKNAEEKKRNICENSLF